MHDVHWLVSLIFQTAFKFNSLLIDIHLINDSSSQLFIEALICSFILCFSHDLTHWLMNALVFRADEVPAFCFGLWRIKMNQAQSLFSVN